ncbi:hypothetical protein JQX09_16520 [Sulfitobacter pseudonitzschiae]|uniref:Uncharacterized protein n=1 Tax=Pseudosulfitobacter pseudonitzschiae TaxID=1402135 RepID=A0A9Q2P355_9RHOB|nr:hypothetical protein [Pseudosulfitobacter pseudonitzschiae]MBM2293637.1 hypothetical protein [Pseudosulfitobacter pseudonitzschiae]MBM2298451.1 hypothetical protein [Pseudosulfitobacter pseudonitzschiae]MBM2303365.1 hypothetical protein [Pseudosulfitobacter pseudonitzschiae]MBM2313148.1 hypothetical protein [Pseudosulfitobacter pseudonitzschiae]MBM2318061.1 hypothetical protein [Pseudosulfitobacter pseudonitzschiae]
MDDGQSEHSIHDKVASWLQTEGYPLEFKTARRFSDAGFNTSQGEYSRKSKDTSPREIDVKASLTSVGDGFLFRAVNVIECKYSVSKPWVNFVSKNHHIAHSACAAQSIGNDYGSAMIWSTCGSSAISSMNLFKSPEEPCFGGRQAFSSGKDQFFDAVRAVSGSAVSIAEGYNRPYEHKEGLPTACVLVFPIIVVQGKLFEAGLNESGSDTFVREVANTRVHWRGSEDRSQFTTIDIVSFDSIDNFAANRFQECSQLLRTMADKHPEFVEFAGSGNPNTVSLSGGSTGMAGPPLLMRKIFEMYSKGKDVAPSN